MWRKSLNIWGDVIKNFWLKSAYYFKEKKCTSICVTYRTEWNKMKYNSIVEQEREWNRTERNSIEYNIMEEHGSSWSRTELNRIAGNNGIEWDNMK